MKPGDKVRLLKSDRDDLPPGTVGTVTDLLGVGRFVLVDWGTEISACPADWLQLVT